MSAALLRIQAIIVTDVILRFRRTSTLVLFLAMCALAYASIPDPSTGMTLLSIGDSRALYNSPAIAFATAALFSLIGIGLLGYYMISNSVKRDVVSGVGNTLAATAMRSWEYIVGKFLGNVAFLTTLTLAYMLMMMLMVIVRGEGSVEPFVFLRTYTLFCLQGIIFVSVVSLVFETLPILSTRVGDIAYFFLWIALLVVSGERMEKALLAQRQAHIEQTFSNIPSVAYIDVMNLSTSISAINAQVGSDSSKGISIGESPFNAALKPVVLREVGLSMPWMAVKAISTLGFLSFLGIAVLAFHRFDPTRLRASARRSKRNIFTALSAALKPLSRLTTILWGGVQTVLGGQEFLRAVASEVLLVLTLHPAALLVFIGLNIAAFAVPMPSVQMPIAPLACLALVFFTADIGIRERQRGSSALLLSTPIMKEYFVWIKVLAAWILGLLFVLVPLVRLAFAAPGAAVSLVVGMLFLSACAVGIGIATGTAKTLMVLSLILFYGSLNSNGLQPALDFAGWFGSATPLVQAGYGAAACGFVALGIGVHWWRTGRA
jgi:hypothetical protein